MGKSIKSRHYQKIIWEKVMDGNASKHDVFTEKSQMETLPSAMISLPGNDQEYVMRDHQPQYTNSIQNQDFKVVQVSWKA